MPRIPPGRSARFRRSCREKEASSMPRILVRGAKRSPDAATKAHL
jgi:hypothetical protein